MKKISWALLVLILSLPAFSQQQLDTLVTDFKALDMEVQRCIAKYGADEVLVALDIDNTILKSDTDLGSDVWYQWQTGSLDIKPTDSQQLDQDCLYHEAISLLNELSTMSLVHPSISSIISGWQKAGVHVMALTARSPDTRPATERELVRNKVDFTVMEPKNIEGDKMEFSYSLSRDLSYENGIFMTSGMDKGKMLEHFIGRAGNQYAAIVFGDDTRKNIDAVKHAYSNNPDTYVALFNYVYVKQNRIAANGGELLTDAQATKMTNDWDILISTLVKLFPERALKTECDL